LKQFCRPRNHEAIAKMLKNLYEGLDSSPKMKTRFLLKNIPVKSKRHRLPSTISKMNERKQSQVNINTNSLLKKSRNAAKSTIRARKPAYFQTLPSPQLQSTVG